LIQQEREEATSRKRRIQFSQTQKNGSQELKLLGGLKKRNDRGSWQQADVKPKVSLLLCIGKSIPRRGPNDDDDDDDDDITDMWAARN
jgi:hypothetical protein